MKCRHCGAEMEISLVDLGSAPPSNAYLTDQSLHEPENWYPLRVLVCENCWLVQTEDFAKADKLFDAEYSYFSGYSTSWLAHSQKYVTDMTNRFNLTEASHVVEIAANDGYLLQYFKKLDISCIGIEPTASTAHAARSKGIPIIEDFFGVRLASQMTQKADLTVANNVLAHVPDINDFVKGFSIILKPEGVATFEFPHLLKLIEENQFDTIYHEHFSYLSLTTVEQIFSVNGLHIFDVEEHSTHGGSLRIFAQRKDTGKYRCNERVSNMIAKEKDVGLTNLNFYSGFQDTVNRIKLDFISFLIEAKRQGKTVAAYGAAAKGNTLLNYAGIRSDLISFVADRNPAKQDKFMPGSRIPIVSESKIELTKPDFVIILPWNLEVEVKSQLDYIKSWGGQFVTAVPKLRVHA